LWTFRSFGGTGVKLKLDENLGELGAEILRAAGQEVATVAGQGLCSSPDPELIEICHRERRCLVTLDKRFGNPFIYPPGKYSGIVVLRVPSPISPDEIRAAVETLAEGLKGADVRGRLWVVRQGKIREFCPYH